MNNEIKKHSEWFQKTIARFIDRKCSREVLAILIDSATVEAYRIGYRQALEDIQLHVSKTNG